MNKRWISRAMMALTLMFILGLATIAAAPKASAYAITSTDSAQSLTCGPFVPVKPADRSNFIANGVKIGYGNVLTDGCGDYEAHVHLSKLPAAPGPYVLYLAQGYNQILTQISTAPKDVYLTNVFAGYPGSVEVYLASKNPNAPNAFYTMNF